MEEILSKKIEAILFFKNEPIKLKKLSEFTNQDEEEVKKAIDSLKENLKNRGIVLIEKDDEFFLGTNPEFCEIIEEIRKEELNKNLTKSSLETLTIILYKNGATKSEIDYIRGVNSNFSLRALSVRGLVEKTSDPSDQRKYIYKPTFDLLSFMGITSISELPEYENIYQKLNKINEEENREEFN